MKLFPRLLPLLLGLHTHGSLNPSSEIPFEVEDPADLEYLASDALDGRVPGQSGGQLAQDYIIEQLALMWASGLN